MSAAIAEGDLTVEYGPQDEPSLSKAWRVFRHRRVVFVNERLGPTIQTVRRLAVEQQCTAWLVVEGNQPLEIDSATLA